MIVRSLEELRRLYAQPSGRAKAKQLGELDGHCRDFIALSPFVILASHGADGRADASPRGGAPGFVKAPSAKELLLADVPGNNRLDTLENIITSAQLGLLFLIPGVDETLRVNGTARLSVDPAHIALLTDERRAPKLVIQVEVQEAYLHCAKSVMRARLWSADAQVARSALPTMGQMLKDQTGSTEPVESQDEMIKRYLTQL